MSTRKKKNNFVQRLIKPIWQSFDAVTKAVVNRLLRSLLVLKRQSSLSRAGFVLPTVIMVILVVTLLTTAIMIRSFDRSKNASNVRVDQAVLKAATPALDRARAKIDKLFSKEAGLVVGIPPTEPIIAEALEKGKYTLGDETQIQLTGDFAPTTDNPNTLKSAWKFPVDTDNNGKFDTFTLYGIYFRTPLTDSSGKPIRARGTTEARALPQNDGESDRCSGGSSAGFGQGWYSIGGQLKRAFFTYVANVPITDVAAALPTGSDPTKYEKYKGNKGFSALEMQLDQAKVSLDNNAVWYNDDISINSIPSLRLNGRVHTNSNLLVSNADANPIKFLQVSSPESCFYNPANAKIVVGGNVAAGDIGKPDSSSNAITVDLYKGKRNPPDRTPVINVSNKTTTNTPSQVAGNSDAFSQRLDLLVEGAINRLPDPSAPTQADVEAQYPEEVFKDYKKKISPTNPGSELNALTQSLETYLANRIRRVSFAEVPIDAPPGEALKIGGNTYVFPTSGEIKPPPEWMLIDESNTKLTLNINGSTMQMPATNPGTGATSLTRVEQMIGDRVQVGNNLPNRWLKPDGTFFKEGDPPQPITGVNWDNGGEQRKRTGLAKQLDNLGDTSRNGFWETSAAKVPTPKEKLVGGLRIVTGGGIYVDGANFGSIGTGKRIEPGVEPNRNTRSFLPKPTLEVDQNDPLNKNLPPNPIVVWPDSMPMYQWIDKGNPNLPKPFGSNFKPEQFKGDLQMRATVVYHYKKGDEPIACISNYYDPTDISTALDVGTSGDARAMSNNGFSYTPPTAAQRVASPRLSKASRMVFPDRRWANKPLYDALRNLSNLSLADKAAIDAANCALSILDNAPRISSPIVPDGAIKEATFLDSRQIKAIHKVATESDGTTEVIQDTKLGDLNNPDHLKMASRESLATLTKTDYTLPLEQRQPLEVRVTQIDLDQLRKIDVDGDFLLPNSGIIYATRDDALPDLSATMEPGNQLPKTIREKKNKPSKTAATDFKLDPTRNANGIRLINGDNLERNTIYKEEEKGLILASDLPVYIKGDFNVHRPSGAGLGGATLEEFTEKLDNTNFYTRSTPEDNFACRKGSPTCRGSSGDQWRAARVLSDAVTLLSDNFRDGYRYEGDYDLRNNAGNLAVESYLDNGFWMNSFATTAKWYNTTTGLPRTDFANPPSTSTGGSSYVMNAVTPIQRRVRFPAYKMEICTKLPASECNAQDWKGGKVKPTWVTGPVLNAWNKDARMAGTTAPPATITPTPTPDQIYTSEHYPRRVAFDRDPEFGQLVLDGTNFHAKPLKPLPNPNALTGTALTYPPTPGSRPQEQEKALWFATTSDNTNPSAGLDYNKSNLLYYAKDELENPGIPTQPVHERQLLLPGTPVFPKEFASIPAFAGQTILNGQTENDPSDFAVCAGNGFSKLYKTPSLGGSCPDALSATTLMRQALFNPAITAPPAAPLDQVLSVDTTTLDLTASPPALTALASKKVNVFDFKLKTTGLPIATRKTISNLTLTLDANGQSDPIFIIRRLPASGTGFGLIFDGVKLQLKGVDPNNIFWVTKFGPVEIKDNPNNQLAGNFLGLGPLNIRNGDQIKGGRFLGFNTANITGSITALTTTAQPLVVPVVQLHSPTGTPGTPNGEKLNKDWLQKAKETTFNAVFVMGDSPARPLPSIGATAAESNGGLGNFPRFLEAWGDNTAAKISGGLIQYKRSNVATAPFEAITNPKTDTALFFDTPIPNLSGELTDFRYPGAASDNRAPYYIPPDRQWGYDVGLLSQIPDLFSSLFESPQADTPNEFFREVARDDKWVNTLLCGKNVDATGNPTTPALPDDQRPKGCPT